MWFEWGKQRELRFRRIDRPAFLPTYGYGSIPMGMNIHFSPAILMWTEGVQAFDPSPLYIYLFIYILNIPAHFAGNLGDATGTLRSLRNQPGVHPKIIDFPAAEKHWEKAIEMGTSGDVEPWFLVLPRKSLAISGRNCTIAYHFCWNQSFCGWSPALLTKSDLVNVIF